MQLIADTNCNVDSVWLLMGSMGRYFGLAVLAGLLASALPALSVPLPPTRPTEKPSEPTPVKPSIDSNGPVAGDAAKLPLCKGADNRKWDNCVGTFTIENLGEYSGEIRDRKPQGTGVFRALDGSLYQGEFQNGVPSGKGRFTSPKGALYIGEFADGVAHGEGSEKAADGNRYSGQYAKGVREGKGQLNFTDGRQYEGDFVADRIEGYGTFSFPNGDSYTGVFYNGDPTDRGIFRFANGDRYVGAFKDFKPSGPGVLTFASGVKFIGGFLEGNPIGPGVLYDGNGDLIFEGEIAGFAAIDQAIRDHDAKQQSKQAAINSAKRLDQASGTSPAADVNTASNAKVTSSLPLVNAQSTKDTKTPANELVVNNVSIAPIKAQPLAEASVEPQPFQPSPPVEPVPEKADIAAKPDQADATANAKIAPSDPAKTESPPSGQDIAQTQATNQNTAVAKTPSSTPPLKCKRGGDLIVSFVSCEVLSTQVEIDHITFPKTNCRSGQDYLAEYDRGREAPWYDVVRLVKTYFYYRPFDYRGTHRYRDELHFLVSRCNRAGDFTIGISGKEWTWPENGEPFSVPTP